MTSLCENERRTFSFHTDSYWRGFLSRWLARWRIAAKRLEGGYLMVTFQSGEFAFEEAALRDRARALDRGAIAQGGFFATAQIS